MDLKIILLLFWTIFRSQIFKELSKILIKTKMLTIYLNSPSLDPTEKIIATMKAKIKNELSKIKQENF